MQRGGRSNCTEYVTDSEIKLICKYRVTILTLTSKSWHAENGGMIKNRNALSLSSDIQCYIETKGHTRRNISKMFRTSEIQKSSLKSVDVLQK